ncbi:MAG TPA: ComEA family DNA-binding protein [Candidatus Omnitrophota bacterium]|nr:ComEA family DNA-binding protein [Candidatus Omnitrophota bacterium]HQJ15134.1 ComEA family DNA-binding protein [Candidatus Omnitrophota bacterium]
MLPLTRQERRVAVFLFIVILAGAAMNYAQKRSRQLRPVFCFDQSYGKININTADAEMLREIPGVGRAIAQRIIDHRMLNGPFMDIEELRRVKGLNGSRFERLKDAVCLE